ncbi:HAD-IC family P-type ATPase [Candidatus Uhrbacteria bacterium]|nr:HAD-IC family P-type ATPase [Candidatus Uhrbacteria bacterium]
MPHPRDLAPLEKTIVLKQLQTQLSGLTQKQITINSKSETNEVKTAKPAGIVRRFFREFKSPLIYILLLVAIISPLIGKWTDAIIIFAVLLLNACIGVYQEGKASEALSKLQHAFVSTTTVRRNGSVQRISTNEVLMGDIVLLQAGDQVPADGRIIQSIGLQVDESALTGESVPVNKTDTVQQINKDTPLGDIRNAAFRQTLIVHGSGEMVVSAIGHNTEIGHIATLLKQHQTEPPLVKKIRTLSRNIAFAVISFSLFLGVIGLLSGRPKGLIIATVASLAVSIIPEGLPVVLTLVLARGVGRMATKNAIVKHQHAVEGLGNIDVICTDKTGTLTENRLKVAYAFSDGELLSLSSGKENKKILKKKPFTQLTLACAALGVGSMHQEKGEWIKDGDPINSALAMFALRMNTQLFPEHILEEIPFSFETKTRTLRFQYKQKKLDILAGAPEEVAKLCQFQINQIEQKTWQDLAKQGQRIIAIAIRDSQEEIKKTTNWSFLGFVGLSDTLRSQVKESVRWCQTQGIRVAMITGDHPDTAFAIAKKAGIATNSNQVLAGKQLDQLDDAILAEKIMNICVFARITPEHKVRIVKAFQAKNKKTAMTGDGVNDAPALQAADIGIAMGKSGTDVAREAADIILTDDHFATIITAIQEGRAIIGNVRKVLTYLFSTSMGEALIISLALIGQLPIPLLPAQILWLNFVTDGLLVVALAMEPTHYSLHAHRDGKLLDRSSVIRISLLGATMAIGSLIVYVYTIKNLSVIQSQSITLLTMAIFQWVNAWCTRSESHSIFKLSIITNPFLILATVLVALTQLSAFNTSFLQNILHVVPISWEAWAISVTVSLSVIVVDEGWKQWSARHRLKIARVAI